MSKATGRVWLCILGVLALGVFTRLGYLQQELIDWDESTLTVVAASFANGHLPYTETWDLKPPMHFLILGEAMRWFGESLATVRLTGAIGWGLVGVFVFLAARRRTADRAAMLAAMLTIIAASPYPFQPTLTEHIAVPFLMAALWLLLAGRQSFWMLFLVGVSMSFATLTRTNLAFPTLAIGFYLASSLFWPRAAVLRLAIVPYVLGGLLPLAAVIGLYAAQGLLDVFITSNVWVPLSYATQQRPALLVLAMVIAGVLAGSLRFPDLWGAMVVFAGAHFWANATFRQPRQWLSRIGGFFKPVDSDHVLVSIVGLSTLLGMTLSGFFTWHHLLQLAPFIGYLSAFAFRFPLQKWRAYLLSLAVFIALARAVPGFFAVFYHGPGTLAEAYPLKQAAQQIERDIKPEDKVLALYGQIIYQYLSIAPPAPIAVHPSNLVRDSIEAALVEGGIAAPNTFAQILNARPRYILVSNEIEWFLDNQAGEDLRSLLAQEYDAWQVYEAFTVFRLE